MKKIVFASIAIATTAFVWRYLPLGADIVTGYSAKQLCSGVFVAELPQSFVLDRDINPRMRSYLGPALGLLQMRVDRKNEEVKTQFLGFSSTAQHRAGVGCTLNPVSSPPSFGAEPSAVKATIEIDQVAPPESLAAAFIRAFAEPEQGGRNTLSIAVMHRGEIIGEQYLAPITSLTPLQGWSMNKSLTATWVGLQVEQGNLTLDLPVLEALRKSGQSLEDIEHKIDPALTLSNLLHMESGFRFEETYLPGDDATQMLYRSSQMWRFAPSRGHRYLPGEHFSYSSGDTNLASFVWNSSLAGKPYQHWLQDNFITPLNLGTMVAEADASHVQVGSSYTYMSTRDWAKVGQFWLDAWHNRTDLLPENWQREATQSNTSDSSGVYGLGFWLNLQGKTYPGLPKNAFYAGGNSGQRVLIFPDQELVIVRLGLSEKGADQGVEVFAAAVLDTFKNDNSAKGAL
ncbi:MAG: CubicO group peptidase (beta-lactamase class C family) [Halioglobus sp.]|jgi:CubicO group peptidase (beta-lactamase class C family)